MSSAIKFGLDTYPIPLNVLPVVLNKLKSDVAIFSIIFHLNKSCTLILLIINGAIIKSIRPPMYIGSI
jgi:hypothetical protein